MNRSEWIMDNGQLTISNAQIMQVSDSGVYQCVSQSCSQWTRWCQCHCDKYVVASNSVSFAWSDGFCLFSLGREKRGCGTVWAPQLFWHITKLRHKYSPHAVLMDFINRLSTLVNQTTICNQFNRQQNHLKLPLLDIHWFEILDGKCNC